MKTKTIFLLLVLFTILSCNKEEVSSDVSPGFLKLNVGLFISVNESENRLKSTAGVDDFVVTVYNSLGIQVKQFARASEVPDEIELEPGSYYVTAHSNNDIPAAFNNPYYYGESSVFSITSGAQQNVTVNCELANTVVTIIYSDRVKANFTDYTTTVSTSAGSLVFTKDETRAGYFRTLPINISVLLKWQKDDGSTGTKTLSGAISDPQPKRKYEIHIDAASAEGSAFLQINLDSLPGATQIVQINEGQSPVPGTISEGALIISEIMFDPLSLNDTEGEWFEIYNTTSFPIDLYHIVISKSATSTDRHVINSHIEIGPSGFIVLSRTVTAVESPDYVYGTPVNLNNTNSTLSLHNYGTDGTDGTLICSINYTASGFPSAQGSSLSLSPALMNYTAATDGKSWCLSVSTYSTGDKGTPGKANDTCL